MSATTPKQTATRRSVTRRDTIESSGGSVGGESQHYRSRSPLSPAREVRMKERLQIQGENNRLAHYIDVVRRLETENETLRIKISRSQETVHHERSQVREMFESELNELRSEVDQLRQEKALAETELSELKAELQEMKPKVKDLEQQNAALADKVRGLEKDLAAAKGDLVASEGQNDLLEKEVNDLRKQLNERNNQLQSARDQLKHECQQRVKAETALMAMEKTSKFEKSLFEQTLRDNQLVKLTEIEEIERRKEVEGNVTMESLLEDIRNQHQDKIEDYKNQKEEHYMQKLVKMRQDNVERDRDLNRLRNELSGLQNENVDMSDRIRQLNDLLRDRDQNVADLENALANEKAKCTEKMDDLKDELDKLKDVLTTQCDEYQDLLDEKLNLDLEISAYRKLLDGEYQRMNIGGPAGPGNKRGRTELDEDNTQRTKRRRVKTDEFFTSEVMQSTKLIGLEIIESDPRGHLVAVQNHTTQEIDLEKYELRRLMGEEVVRFFFPAGIVLQPKAVTLVHSMKSPGGYTELPESIVAENMRQWPVGDEYTTYLYNPEGQEVAARHCRRRVTHEEHIDLDHVSTNQEKCVIS
ncbi:prelamin-A/C-like [Convolutriloba macropyga]|uniref:prelamin-A/C-like n=1 Tax=Convolutriloba macropyga TaxID=536237 RepID=UPI003F51ECC8